MYKEEQEFLKTIKEIKDKETPLMFTKLEALILLNDYKEQLLIQRVSQRSELLLSAICQFTKRNTQKEIQEVEKWIETDFRK